jgi:hypothetical protein
MYNCLSALQSQKVLPSDVGINGVHAWLTLPWSCLLLHLILCFLVRSLVCLHKHDQHVDVLCADRIQVELKCSQKMAGLLAFLHGVSMQQQHMGCTECQQPSRVCSTCSRSGSQKLSSVAVLERYSSSSVARLRDGQQAIS